MDNQHFSAKLNLRRHFLKSFSGELNVLDCCQGSGQLWSKLRSEFDVSSYWGVDQKSKKGRMKIDSVRLLNQRFTQNVIDVDTYGSPWKHWLAMLPNITQPTLVFLTFGRLNTTQMTSDVKRAMGLTLDIPQSLTIQLHGFGLNFILAEALKYCRIVESAEMKTKAVTAQYFGLQLEPR